MRRPRPCVILRKETPRKSRHNCVIKTILEVWDAHDESVVRLSSVRFLHLSAALILLLALAPSLPFAATAFPERLDLAQAQDAGQAAEAKKPQDVFQSGPFTVQFDRRASPASSAPPINTTTDYIQLNRELGHARVVYKMGENPGASFPPLTRRKSAGPAPVSSTACRNSSSSTTNRAGRLLRPTSKCPSVSRSRATPSTGRFMFGTARTNPSSSATSPCPFL